MSKPRIYYCMIGAAGDEVTGSCTVLRIEYNNKVYYGLIDVGIVQGQNDQRNYNFPIDGSKIDFVILTHAHADHFGAAPLLKGFNGKIYSTASALNQGREILDDAGFNNEQNAACELGISSDAYRSLCNELERLSKRKNAPALERYNALLKEVQEIKSYSLYTCDDVVEISKHFCAVSPYQDIKIGDGLYIRLIPSTHQNGAVSVEVYVGDYGEDSVNISFSGDIGPSDSFFYKNHTYNKNALINYCVMESLHGLEEKKQTPEEAYQQIKKIVLPAIKRGKTVILDCFALDRSAMAVYAMNRIMEEEKISIDTYLDSRLAVKELIYYQADYANKNNCWFKDLGRKPFSTDKIIIPGKLNQHMNVVRDTNAKVVITCSAFGEGGRVLDYFDHYIQDKNAIFVFVGWLSPNCTSNVLLSAEKGKIVEIHGNHYVKHCDTVQISGFSSHGYYPEFIEYIERFPSLKGLILNHAGIQTKEALKEKLEESYEFDILIPEMYDSEYRSFYSVTSECICEVSVLEGYDVFRDVIKCSVIA